MANLLIIESNAPAILARGNASASGFVRSLMGLAPTAELRVMSPYARPLSPACLDGVDGVVFTGSTVSWGVDGPEAAPLRDAMELVFRAGLPVWGSCNGLQLATVVLGGAVGPSPHGIEIGLARDVQITLQGATHPMMAGRQNGFAVPCMHRDEVRQTPDGAEILATNAHSPVQAMAYCAGGVDFWGTQYHPELTPADVAYCVHEAGLFHEQTEQTADLEIAAFDADAATRLGGSLAQLHPCARTRELANWIQKIEAMRGMCPNMPGLTAAAE